MSKTQEPFYEKYMKKKRSATDVRQRKTIKKSISKSEHIQTGHIPDGRQKKENKAASVEQNYMYGTAVFSELSPQASRILYDFPDILGRILRLDSKKRQELPQHIHDLFHELTDERSHRKTHYMNNPVKLSAYMHYYLWWNLVRLTKLLQNMDFCFDDLDTAADFGSGPLTFVCALWIAQPTLRKKKLTWYCVDISQKALNFGEELFLAFCAYTEQTEGDGATPWEIKKVTGTFGTRLKEKVSLVTEANMFNEIFWDSPLSLEEQAHKSQRIITQYLNTNGSVLLIEPGIPLAGEFISNIRRYFLKNGFSIQAPCPHTEECPFPHQKFTGKDNKKRPLASNKWCHFVFDTQGCPKNLLRLSSASNLGKQRASLTFLYCTKKVPVKKLKKKDHPNKAAQVPIRICSDVINLTDRNIGRYACSQSGFMLMKTPAYRESPLNKAVSGSLLFLPKQKYHLEERDKKTGAVLVEL